MFEARKICLLSAFLVLPASENRIEQVIRAYCIPARKDKHAAYNETLKKIEEGKRRRIEHGALLLSPVYRIAISTAASLILIFLLQLLLFSQTRFESTDQAATFRLPDQSRVVLSENSSISYSKYIWNRKVKLQGEAYFEVQKGEKFIVKTDEGSVSVLGTRFLITEKEDKLKVSCYEGKVAYENKKLQEVIPAGTSKEFKNDELISSETTDVTYPQTAVFSANYSGEQLNQVTKDLEDFFQVTIHLETSRNLLFSATLETANLESALKIISRSLNLHYSFKTTEEVFLTEKQ
ncbi:FecR family protein [Mangrovibacterium lignilyticum]|uniref:FecR family protein n=1 Tax=Mangrovibacterium lignilyticum TaxID=2668052 RepID=UPI0013D5E970|nr:FecR family protein [Mangrovibacterium lignilyticum]